jgi:hypothetical protein
MRSVCPAGSSRTDSTRPQPRSPSTETCHGEGDYAWVGTLVAIARAKGVSGCIGDGANRWPAAHRLDIARLSTGKPTHPGLLEDLEKGHYPDTRRVGRKEWAEGPSWAEADGFGHAADPAEAREKSPTEAE